MSPCPTKRSEKYKLYYKKTSSSDHANIIKCFDLVFIIVLMIL